MNNELLLLTLLFLLILWLYSSRSSILCELHDTLIQIVGPYYPLPDFTLEQSSERSYVVDKTRICLVTHHPLTHRPFDRATLLRVALHELAHIISPHQGHTPRFEAIEANLLTLARNQGYSIDEIDTDYPHEVLPPGE